MTFHKKINAKNAFEINTEYLDNLPNILNQREESSWQTASNGLEAFAHVYSYRVDSVHTDMFKILGGLHRNQDEEKDNQEKGNEVVKKKKNKHIEENHEKLNLKEYDLEFQIDPLFKQTTNMFSQINARGLLQFCLDINDKLDLVLEGSTSDFKENQVKQDEQKKEEAVIDKTNQKEKPDFLMIESEQANTNNKASNLVLDNILFNFHNILNFFWFHLELFGKLFNGWLTVKFLGHATLCTEQFVDSFNHVHWDTDSAGLVGNGTSNRLANPPSSVGRKLKAFIWVELFNRT